MNRVGREVVGRLWLNALLVVVSVAVCTVAAEFVVRQLDANADNAPAERHLDEIAACAGVDRVWFFADPPPLPNRRAVPQEWLDLVSKVEQSGVTEGTRRADMFKAWNAELRRRSLLVTPISAARQGTSICTTRRQASAAALPLPAQRDDADWPGHQRLRISRTARAVRASAADGAHRLHRCLDHRRQSLLSLFVSRVRRQLAEHVGRVLASSA